MANFVYITKELIVGHHIFKCFEVGIVTEKNETNSIIQFVDCPTPVEVPNSIIKSFDPNQIGDQFNQKICNRCNRLLPVNNFQKNQNGKNNRTVRRPSCNDCRDLIDGKDIPAKIKRELNRTKPDMVVWECPICKKRTIPGLTSKIVLDHNHYTGMPNTWICDSCNTGLGRFNDNIVVMEEAIKYLQKYQK